MGMFSGAPRTRAIGSAVAVSLIGLAPVGVFAAATEESSRFYEDAQVYLDKGNVPAAIVQLKNAIVVDPEDATLRFALGSAYLRIGNPDAAESEFKAAWAAGLDQARIIGPLAQAYLLQGEYEELLDSLSPVGHTDAVASDILISRGYAQIGLRQFDEADLSFTDAISLSANAVGAHIGRAQLLLQRGLLTEAERQIDSALKITPNSPQALGLKGEIRRLAKDESAAERYFDDALAADPYLVIARIGRAALRIDQGRLQDAEGDVQQILALAPDAVAANFLEALILARRDEFRAASDRLVKLTPELSSYPPSLYLLALLHYKQNEVEQAETFLKRYVGLVDTDVGARKILGGLLLAKGSTNEALKVLMLAAELAPQDGQVLALLGSASMQAGRYAEAASWFDKAVAATPDDLRMPTQTQLAAPSVPIGHPDAAIEEMQAAINLDPGGAQARVLLVLTQLRNGELERAAAVAGDLVARMPDSPIAHNLSGAVDFAKDNLAAARGSFETAIRLDPAFAPAQVNLGRLNEREGEFGAAKGNYEAVLERDPLSVVAMSAIAELELKQGRVAEAEHWLEKAAQSDERSIAPRLFLVRVHLDRGDSAAAMAVARDLQRIAPESFEVLDSIAEAQVAAGKTADALATARHMAVLAPQTAPAQFRLAQTLRQAGDVVGSQSALENAIALDDAFLPAHRGLVAQELQSGNGERALQLAAEWRMRHATSAGGDILVGDVLSYQGAYTGAAAAYSAAFAKEVSSENALRFYEALLQAGRQRETVDGLAKWANDHPGDQAAHFALASAFLVTKQYDAARDVYERQLKKDPENPVLLNNLAWLYGDVDDQRALPYAERAYTLAPRVSAIADTLGYLLIRNGQLERGLELLQRVHSEAPEFSDAAYHLAVALEMSGRDVEARTLLEKLLSSRATFIGREEAEVLMQKLSAKP